MLHLILLAKSARNVEYIDYISTEEWDSPKCPGYDTKLSDGKAPVMLELWECGVPFLCSDWVLSIGQIELFDI